MSVTGSRRNEALPGSRKNRIDDQQYFICKNVFEQRRCQRGTSPDDKARAVLRLDAANTIDKVRSDALDIAPFKAVSTVGRDVFRRGVEPIRHWTDWSVWREARPRVVGGTAN